MPKTLIAAAVFCISAAWAECSDADKCYASDNVQDETSLLQTQKVVNNRGKLKEGNKKVLIVIDMQNDYRGSEGIDKAIATIQDMKTRTKTKEDGEVVPFFDLTIYTKDWLKEGDYDFAVADTPGAEIVDDLKPGHELESRHGRLLTVTERAMMPEVSLTSDKNHWLFTKSADDAFNLQDDEVHEWTVGDHYFKSETGRRKVRKFSVDFQQEGLEAPLPLAVRMLRAGYAPSDTDLYFTGVLENQCVMKSAIHARMLGYSVTIPRDGVAGGAEDMWEKVDCPEGVLHCAEAEEFKGKGKVPKPEIQCAVRDECTEEEIQTWARNIYHGWQHGPSLDDVPLYLQSAGITLEGEWP